MNCQKHIKLQPWRQFAFCKDEEKYKVVEDLVKQVEELKKTTKIDGQTITDVLTVNGVLDFH
jgi:hypothetical protein